MSGSGKSITVHEEVEVTDPRLKELSKESDFKEAIPNGYIPVELSTKGRLGAPARFHVRNFDTKDLLNLALSEDEDLPVKLIAMLDQLILEKSVSVKDFHEKEVIEMLIVIYRSFYSKFFKDLPYQMLDDDWAFMKTKLGGEESEEFRTFERSIKNGGFKPKVSIDIDTLSYYPVDENLKTSVRAVKGDGFSLRFSFPRYGDVVILKEFIDEVFKEQDKQYAKLLDILRYRQDSEERIRKGENIAYASLPNITDFDRQRVREYQAERGIFTVDAVKGLHLVEIDGKDVSQLPLAQRITLAKAEPRIDHTTLTQVTEYFNNQMKVGPKEDVMVLNPIQGKQMLRKYSFQLVDLLQATRDAKPDELTLQFE